MPDNEQPMNLPFITRHMLKFGDRAQFELRINTQADEAIEVQVTGLTRNGTFSFRHTTNSDSSVKTQDFRVPDMPLLVSVQNIDEDASEGQVFARLSLRIDSTPVQDLCSGYVSYFQGISWPYQNKVNQLPLNGRFMEVDGTDPSAGADAVVTVPNNEVWLVTSVRCQLVTDANAATRRVWLECSAEAGNQRYLSIASVTQAASLTREYVFSDIGFDPGAKADNLIAVPLPTNLYLRAADEMRINCENDQAGDNFTAMQVRGWKWYSNEIATL